MGGNWGDAAKWAVQNVDAIHAAYHVLKASVQVLPVKAVGLAWRQKRRRT